MSIFTGVILGKNDDGTYRLQPTRTMHPYDRVPAMDGAVHGVGEEVPYGLVGGDPQRPQILARTVRSWSIPPKATGWHCQGYDGRRSFGTEDASALPPSVVGGAVPVVDGDWLPAGGVPSWLDETSGTIGASAKLLSLEGVPRAYPTSFSAYGPQYVLDGKAYLQYPVRCVDIATGTSAWTSPDDADGIQSWTGLCVSDDGKALYSLAEQDVGNGHFDLWVRAQATKDGSLLWRTKVSAASYKRGGVSGLVHDGTLLYVRFTPEGRDTATELDLSSLSFMGAYGQVNASQYSAKITEHHVVAVKAASGGRQWEVILPNVMDRPADSPLMMIGDHVGFSYARLSLPSTARVLASMEAGSYVSQQSNTTYYYPEMKLATLGGLSLEWRLARISATGSMVESLIVREDYEVEAYSGRIIVPVGTRPNRLGYLFTGRRPILEAASRDGSIIVLTKSMDSNGTSGTYYAYEITTVENAYPDYWTSGRDEGSGPPYGPVWNPIPTEFQDPFIIWLGSQGGIGSPREFIPPNPGTAPNLRYYVHGGTIFGGNSAGMTVLLESGAENGLNAPMLARITAGTLGAYTAIPSLPASFGLIAANGYAYTHDGTHTRRLK